MSALALVALVLLSGKGESAHAASAKHVFGAWELRGSWYLVDLTGRSATQYTPPEGYRLEHLAVRRDGKQLVLTARTKAHPVAALYVIDRSADGPPKLLTDDPGYYEDATFSGDGAWIYFSHARKGMGKVEAHSPDAYGQIFRIRPDGRGLEQLTTTPGCKFQVRERNQRLTYLHSSCHGPRSLEILDTSTRQTQTISLPKNYGHPTFLGADDEVVVEHWTPSAGFQLEHVSANGAGTPAGIDVSGRATGITELDGQRFAFLKDDVVLMTSRKTHRSEEVVSLGAK